MRLLRSLFLVALAVASAADPQDVVPGLLAQLESQSWSERWAALDQIVKLPDAMRTPAVRSALLSRLNEENQILRQTLRESNGARSVGDAYGEGYGEYYAGLLGAVGDTADWGDSTTLRILAQSTYDASSGFARRLAAHVEDVLPTLTEDADGDVARIRTAALEYVAEILRVYKPSSLTPDGAAKLLALLNKRATAAEVDPNVRYRSAQLLGRLADVNRDGKVDCADVAVVRSAMGTRAGGTGFDPRADINLDRLVDERDLHFVTARLPAGLRCQEDQ
jgi:hypothetical protein